MLKSFDFLRPRREVPFLFLASHGLRTHLSALRWASGRLRKTAAEGLSREQKHLIAEIAAHTKVLTTALNSLLILERIEQKEYSFRRTTIALLDLLQLLRDETADDPVEWVISAPQKILIRADDQVIRHVFADLAALCREAARPPRRVHVEARAEQRNICMSFTSPWDLPFLSRAYEQTGQKNDGGHALGGTPGLMLSLAGELARHAGGGIELEEMALDMEDLLSDGTVEPHMAAGNDYRIILRLPLA